MFLTNLTSRSAPWLRDGGNDSDVAISSRIRLARNLSGFPFVDRATEGDLQRVVDVVGRTVEKKFAPGEVEYIDFKGVSEEDSRFLFERQLISRDFNVSDKPRALLVEENERFGAMINEEDHLRLQATTSGFALWDVWKTIDELDDRLESELDYAFDEKYGYLTACPSNVGTGIRAGVMLHLPALVETNEISKVLRGLQKMNLTARGIYGEGSRALGEFFQISNQTTLGASEEKIIERLCEVVSNVVDYERRARAAMLEADRKGLLDRCFRAVGILKSAREMSAAEAMNRLSSVRLGIRLGLIENASVSLVNELFLHVQSAHLVRIARASGKGAAAREDEDVLRADYLRERLADLSCGES